MGSNKKTKIGFKFQVSSFKKLLLFSPILFLWFNIANGATLYLEPSEGEYQSGDVFIIKIKIDIGEECINTVKADLKFSQEVLEAVDFSQGDSILTLWLEFPEIDQSEGLISFTGGVPAGYCGEVPGSAGDSNLLGRIVFKVQDIETSEAKVEFLNTSQVLLNDGLGTVDELSTKGAVYTILQYELGPVKDEWQQELEQDKIPPEIFEIEIHQDSAIFEGKYFIIFSTIDKQTGLDLYEVKEGERDWQRADSPYLLEDQTLQSIIKVKAVDKAGNERIAEHIPLKSFPYWIIILIVALIIMIVGIWWMLRKKIHKYLHLFVFFFVLTCVFLPKVAEAATASLYLSPSSGSFLVGSTFTVSVFLDTEGNEINTVFAELKFPPKVLQITSPTAGSSFVAEWLTPPNYSNEKGIVSFRGGIPGGITTSAGLVSSITFRAMVSGNAKIEFRQGSKVLLNDGKGTDILTTTVDGEYHILVPASEGPEVFSPTHFNPNLWYPDSSPAFSWEKEKGVTDFSWSFNENSTARSDGTSEGAQTSISFDNVEDGIWYFHLRQKKDGVWGKTSHVQIRIDTSAPREFIPTVETSSGLIDYQALVYFETSDDFSGIDHYEVSMIELSAKESSRAFFTEEISPYKVPFKKAGKYNVIIKAIDRAGNIRESEVRFRMVTPLISHIEGRGIQIRGVLLSWWLIFGIILIIGAIILVGTVLLVRRKPQI